MAAVAVSPLMRLLTGTPDGAVMQNATITSPCGLDIPIALQLGSKNKHPERTDETCKAFKKTNKQKTVYIELIID